MRRLLWFTIGFGTVCAVWAYQVEYSWMLLLLPVVAIGIGLLLKKKQLCRIMCFVISGCLVASIWTFLFDAQVLGAVRNIDGSEQILTITASDYSYDTSYRRVVDGTTHLSGKQYQIRAYLELTDEISDIEPGDCLSGSFQLRTTVPGGRDESVYHQGKGIYLMAYGQEDVIVAPAEFITIREYPAIAARKIENLLKTVFPEDVFAFTKALILGNSYDLDYETDTALKISGIRHIIAVSGLHISILYGAVAILSGRKRYLTPAIALPLLALFAAMVGFTPSVTRACIMVGLMSLSVAFMREYDPPSALSFSCLVMLFMNPLVITSASLQMSVLCVVGILLFQQRIKIWLSNRFPGKERWRSWLWGNISVSISAMSLVTPLSAWYFGTISLIGVVTNLLTIWLVSGIFLGIIVICLVSIFSMGAASILGWMLAWPVRYILIVAKICASLPYSAVYTESIYISAWLAFCYGLLVAYLLLPKQSLMRMGSYVSVGFCLAIVMSYMEPMTDDVRITMLDVGQGQSILLQSHGNSFLVDCGGDDDEETADIIAEHLLGQGISSVDAIVITHYDRDHAGSLENLLTRIDADLIVLPDTPDKIQDLQDQQIMYLWDTSEITLSNGRLTIYGPVFHGESNENSLCVLFETEKCDILITGDRTDFGERMLMRRTVLPDVDILVAGHHGAESATSEELLQLVKPEMVLISAGKDNIYGHPNPKLLQRLYDAGIFVRRTDQEGTILIRR